MLALSLHQPWASLLVFGAKRVETRGWPLRYRGPLAVHAAKRWTGELQDLCLASPFREALAFFGVPARGHRFTTLDVAHMKAGWNLPFGAVVGKVDVVGCIGTDRVGRWEPTAGESPRAYFHDSLGAMGPSDGEPYLFVSDTERAFGDYAPGRFAFLTADPVRLEAAVPFAGHQGLFTVPGELIPALLTRPPHPRPPGAPCPTTPPTT